MKSKTKLYRAFDFAAAWDAVVRPWFEAAAPLPARSVAVLVPTMAYGQFLKSQLVHAGLSIMGIHFLTPGQCWIMLCDKLGLDSRVASRADLHMLLSVAAEQYPGVPSARSIAGDPSALMRSLDQLAASGWDWTDLDIDALQPIIRKFRQLLEEAGLVVAQDIDRKLARQAAHHAPVFLDLLVIGFDGRHWPVWPLLNAAVASSESACVCLYEPRLTAANIDQVWVGSWEEICGEAEPVPELSSPSPLIRLTDAMEAGAVSETAIPVDILIGNDMNEEAQAIVAHAVSWMADSSCERLGIIFPGPGPLARETARLLTVHDIPHHDSLGHNSAPAQSDLAWREWLSLQEQPDVQRFISFLRLCPESAGLLGQPLEQLEDQLRQAYEELMVDDLRVLAAYLKHPLRKNVSWLADSAAFPDFVAAVRDVIAIWPSLGGTERLNLVLEEAVSFDPAWRHPLPRHIFIKWLTDITANIHRIRETKGNHPFAKVQILAYDRAEWQSWSHVILAGLNRNSWPPDFKPQPFLDPTLIDALNSKAIRQGSQGEGHLVVKPGKGMIISPSERSAHVRRQFYNIIESASAAVCFTASRTDPDNAARPWNPSDLLVRIHAAAAGTGLSDEEMDKIQATTTHWVKNSHPLRPAVVSGKDDSVNRTRHAFQIRRDATRPFGPSEFGLESPPTTPVAIPCTSWEQAVKWPELVWLQFFLGVRDTAWSLEEIPWSKVIGLWVHRWTHTSLSEPDIDSSTKKDTGLHAMPPRRVSEKRLATAMQETLTKADQAFGRAGRSLPDWWRFVHSQACSACDRIVRSLGTLIEQGWSAGATEWTLPKNLRIDLPDGRPLNIRGRMDLVLAQSSSNTRWILDYKTGSAVTLTPASVAGGNGLQVLLYAMALKAAGNESVLMSIATPDEEIGEPVDAAELLQDERILHTLSILGRMQERGVFGMLGAIRPEHGFSPTYPLATLRINPDILEEKWALTFGEQTLNTQHSMYNVQGGKRTT